MQSRSLAVAAEGAGGRPAAGCFSTWFIYLAHRGAAEAAAAADGEVFKVRAGQKHKCFLRNTPEPRLIQSCGQRKTCFCYTLSFLLLSFLSSSPLLVSFSFSTVPLSSLRFLSSLFSSSSRSYPYPSLRYLPHDFFSSFLISPSYLLHFSFPHSHSFLPLLPPSIPILLSAFLFFHLFSICFNLLFHRPHSHVSLSFPSFPFLSLFSLMPFSLISSFCFLSYLLSILFF